jgi:hypothetical protein
MRGMGPDGHLSQTSDGIAAPCLPDVRADDPNLAQPTPARRSLGDAGIPDEMREPPSLIWGLNVGPGNVPGSNQERMTP